MKNFTFAVRYKGKHVPKRMMFRACADEYEAIRRANEYEWKNPLYLLSDCREEK